MPTDSGTAEARTALSLTRRLEDAASIDEQVEQQRALAQLLLAAVNALLRWYRHETGHFGVTELVASAVGEFCFTRADGTAWGPAAGTLSFQREEPRLAHGLTVSELSRTVAEGAASGAHPPAPSLLLLDAREAVDAGRYRESVLLAWSAIEAAFSTAFARQVKAARTGDDATMLLRHQDMSLLNRMTAGLQYVTGRSFADVDEERWADLRGSYRKRNAIIHEGDTATATHATQAISVATHVQQVLDLIEQACRGTD